MGKIGDKKDPLLWNPLAPDESGKPTNDYFILNTKNGKFNVLTYPEELGNKRYPHYILFYINAQSKSALIQNPTPGVNTRAGAGTRTAGQGLTQDPNVINFADAVTKDVVNNAIVNAVTFGTAKDALAISTQKRLSVALALPMPINVTFNSSADFQMLSSGMIGSILKDFAAGDAAVAGQDFLKKMISDTPQFLTGSEEVGKIVNKMLGIVTNDRREQAFKGMDTRTFQFSWLLIPRTQQESKAIHDIIKFFRYNMHPEVDEHFSSGMNLIIPNEVDIEFHNGSKEMEGIQKISTCLIQDVNVDVTPLGKWIAFDGTDNPVATQLTITFKEIEPLTRQMIVKGY